MLVFEVGVVSKIDPIDQSNVTKAGIKIHPTSLSNHRQGMLIPHKFLPVNQDSINDKLATAESTFPKPQREGP